MMEKGPQIQVTSSGSHQSVLSPLIPEVSVALSEPCVSILASTAHQWPWSFASGHKFTICCGQMKANLDLVRRDFIQKNGCKRGRAIAVGEGLL